jgi:hypothetical protein
VLFYEAFALKNFLIHIPVKGVCNLGIILSANTTRFDIAIKKLNIIKVGSICQDFAVIVCPTQSLVK